MTVVCCRHDRPAVSTSRAALSSKSCSTSRGARCGAGPHSPSLVAVSLPSSADGPALALARPPLTVEASMAIVTFVVVEHGSDAPDIGTSENAILGYYSRGLLR